MKSKEDLMREGLAARARKEGCPACGSYHGSETLKIDCLTKEVRRLQAFEKRFKDILRDFNKYPDPRKGVGGR